MSISIAGAPDRPSFYDRAEVLLLFLFFGYIYIKKKQQYPKLNDDIVYGGAAALQTSNY